jgi:hypothetical protein
MNKTRRVAWIKHRRRRKKLEERKRAQKSSAEAGSARS